MHASAAYRQRVAAVLGARVLIDACADAAAGRADPAHAGA
jgi:carbon-monoxide dehydrogenase medium subunit